MQAAVYKGRDETGQKATRIVVVAQFPVLAVAPREQVAIYGNCDVVIEVC